VNGRTVTGIGIASIAFALLATAAYAQERKNRLPELIAEVLRENPEILAAQKRYEAARQRPAQAGALDETMFSAGYASSGKPLPFAGIGKEPTSNVGFMLTQEFPFPGKRQLRSDIAYKEAEADFQRYELVRLNVVSRLKQAYFRILFADSIEDVLQQNRELLQRMLKVTEIRYSVGHAAQQDVFKAQTQLSVLQTRLMQVRRDRQAREIEIASLLNRPPGFRLEFLAPGEPPALYNTLDDVLAFAEKAAPMVREDQKMLERAELAVNLARKEFYPDYAVSAGYFYMGAMPDMYQVRFDLKLPTSFFRKQRAGLAEQTATVSEARRNYEATGRNLRFNISDDFLTAQTSISLMKMYQDTLVPQASLAMESSLPVYEAGRLDFLSVLTNFMARLELQMS
jgi:outer membrane protein TolC